MSLWYRIRHRLERLVPTEPSGLPWGLTVEAILSTMPGYLAVVDMERRILLVNPMFLETFGYRYSELITYPIAQVVVPEGSPFEGEAWARLVQEGAVADVETAYRTKDGTAIPVDFHARLVYDHLRRPVGAVTVAMDMRRIQGLIQMLRTFSNDLRQKAEALEASQRQLQEKMAEMERFHKLVIDREIRMAELKEEIRLLREQVGAR